MRIICVDDDPSIGLLLTAALRHQLHAEVELYPSAEALLSHLPLPAAPDLFLLDVMLPALDGFGLYRRLRLEKSLVNVPMIFLSALGPTDLQQAQEMGALGCIAKPFAIRGLGERIQSLLTSFKKVP